MTTTKRAFTLLEISVSMLLVGIIASVVAWQMRGLLVSHRFSSSVETLVREIKELQALALSYRAELELKIFTDANGQIFYKTATDEVKMLGRRHSGKLKGVERLHINDKPAKEASFTIYSTGRVDPGHKIALFAKDGAAATLDLNALQIKAEATYKKSYEANQSGI